MEQVRDISITGKSTNKTVIEIENLRKGFGNQEISRYNFLVAKTWWYLENQAQENQFL
jgi:hypothetical protein